jgi:RHS repeat-associated protein
VGLSKYVWDGWNLLAELDITDASVRTFAWGLDLSGSEQGAGGIGGLVLGWTRANGSLGGEVNGTGGNTLRYVFDGNGNVMAALDDLGRVRATSEYGPFGETLTSEGDLAADNPIRWSTKYTDGESGLVYYGYRYYNAGTGRWLNRDPIGERGGVAVFTCIRNELLNTVDSLGLEPPDLFVSKKLANGQTLTSQLRIGPWRCRPEFITECEAKCARQGLKFAGCIWVADLFIGVDTMLFSAGGSLAFTKCCCTGCSVLSPEKNRDARKRYSRALERIRTEFEKVTEIPWPTESVPWSKVPQRWPGHHVDDLWHGGSPDLLENIIPVPLRKHLLLHFAYRQCENGDGGWSQPGPYWPFPTTLGPK